MDDDHRYVAFHVFDFEDEGGQVGPIIMENPSARSQIRSGFLHAWRMSPRLKPFL